MSSPIQVPHSKDALKVGDLKQRPQNSLGAFFNLFLPNRHVSPTATRILVLVELAIALVIWFNSPFKVLPRPEEIFAALGDLWKNQGLAGEITTSVALNLKALGLATLISLTLAYLTVIPAIRPIVAALTKTRFLSLIGFTLLFTLLFGGGANLKTSLMVFGITAFYLTGMASVIATIPRAEFEHARTLRMSESRVVWEVVILGTAEKAFEVLRQNAAIGWMMLTMVEGIVRSEGGVGALLLAEQKHFRLAELFAIQGVILLVGLLQDYGIGLLRKMFCPYADITMERK